MLKEALYTGKILLFGEYGIIQDSMGLSIPYHPYKGSLKFDSIDQEQSDYSNGELIKFKDFLGSQDNGVEAQFDIARLSEDLGNGMHFDSSIPEGFGVGSSGAIVAAIYDNYALDAIAPDPNINSKSLARLKGILGQMEAYFHGKSSGLDPLICYLKLPILIKSKNEMNTVGLPSEGDSKGGIFLLNTGMTGKTQPLVNHFLERCKEEGFRKMLKKEFKKYNDACIESFLRKDVQPLMENVKELSKVLLAHFKPMIPEIFHKLWKQGIDSNAYYLKLCGSGGGGFILGFTEDYDKASSMLKDYQLNRIYSF
ncbi:MAG: mevalonate kinase [Flavobacteriales bacterium]|nr:mevalonate kinase [Flavobacteriales bacterium]NNK80025.1 mevalonate kinase [Flavobacteriales bacterium]